MQITQKPNLNGCYQPISDATHNQADWRDDPFYDDLFFYTHV